MAGDLLTILHDLVREIGGYAGSLSAGAVAHAYSRFKTVESNAKAAFELVTVLKTDFDTFRKSLNNQDDRQKGSCPSFHDIEDPYEKRFKQLDFKIDEFKKNIEEIRKDHKEFVKGDIEQWNELNRDLGVLQGKLMIALEKMKT